ncbi:MAG: hypothetical protein V2A73_18095 [Pseudomonadota bacterium]
MSPQRSPLQMVKEQFGSKDTLVEKVLGLVEHGEVAKDELKERLLKASNKKLLRLAETAESIRSQYGSKEALANAVAGMLGKAKDISYVKRIGKYTSGRLLDMARTLAKKGRQDTKS